MANEVSYDAGFIGSVVINDRIALAQGGGLENLGVIKNNANENVGEGEGDDKKKNANQQPQNTKMKVSTVNKSRMKLSEMYDELRTLLPQLPPKASRPKIVDETVKYIQSLEKTVENLERKKLEKLQGVSESESASVTPLVPSQKLAINEESANQKLVINSDKPTNDSNKCSSMGNLGTNSITSPIVFKTLASSDHVTMNVCGSEAHINICTLKKPGLIPSVCYILEKNNLETVTTSISSDDDANIMIMTHVRVNVPHEPAEEFPYEELYKQVANEIYIMLNVNNGIKE